MLPVISAYLKDNIDPDMVIKKWDEINRMPIFLRSIYNYYRLSILGVECLMMEITGPASNVDTLRKHIDSIAKITDLQIVLYYHTMTAYRRKSLIHNRIAFMTQDEQLFLPFLGMRLKKTNEDTPKESRSFTPSAQIVFLYFLYSRDTAINTTELAEFLGMTLMTASRALNSLLKAKLLTFEMGGKTARSKTYKRIADPDYFDGGKEWLSSPVRRSVHISKVPQHSFAAGLEALAALSMINPPGYKIRAISSDHLKDMETEIIMDDDRVKDERLTELQVWSYPPELFAKEGMVDPASLYASFKEDPDERISQALQEVLRSETWYMD